MQSTVGNECGAVKGSLCCERRRGDMGRGRTPLLSQTSLNAIDLLNGCYSRIRKGRALYKQSTVSMPEKPTTQRCDLWGSWVSPELRGSTAGNDHCFWLWSRRPRWEAAFSTPLGTFPPKSNTRPGKQRPLKVESGVTWWKAARRRIHGAPAQHVTAGRVSSPRKKKKKREGHSQMFNLPHFTYCTSWLFFFSFLFFFQE